MQLLSRFIFMAVFVISKTHMLTGTVLLEKVICDALYELRVK